MKIADARILAEEQISKTFNVRGNNVCAKSLGYKFEFMTRKRTLGLCNYVKKTIYLSEDYVMNNSLELVLDTILHELAHAFAYHLYMSHGHDRAWKLVCMSIGARPNRCKSSEEINQSSISSKYVLRNKETLEVYEHYYRWPAKIYQSCVNNTIWLKNQPHLRGKLEVVGTNA